MKNRNPHFKLHRARSRRANERRGIALFVVLFAMFAAGAVLLVLLSGAASRLADLRDNRQRLQADELADAGAQRAIAQLRKSSAYRGETWQIAADELSGDWPAEVKIAVATPDESNQAAFRVTVQADYPPDEIYRTRRSRDVQVNIKPEGNQP